MEKGVFDFAPVDRVIWGEPAHTAVAGAVRRVGAGRALVVASRTLSRKTELITRIRDELGDSFGGLFDSCQEHTPLESVIDCAAAARQAEADIIVTVGGGTPIDTVKIVQLCLAAGVDRVEDLKKLANRPRREPTGIRQIIVPTTLSGGEYTSIAGGTDTEKKLKESYMAPDMCGQVIILDPAASVHTPEWLWLSTAIRGLDHAVEGYCAEASHPFLQGQALHAMRLFSTSLRQTKKDPKALDARLQSQFGVWLCTVGLGRVPMGASHGIGYLLGTVAGVPHGYTSCVMLPGVLEWNRSVCGPAQEAIVAALGQPGDTATAAVGSLLDDLGLPRTLRDVGVKQEQLDTIAEMAMFHPVVRSNPRPITAASEVREILDLVW